MSFDKRTFRRTRAPAEPDVTNTPPRTYVLLSRTLPDRAYPALLMTAFALLVTAVFEDLNPKWMWTDSAVFQYVGKVILAGGMPYRDTFDHKGPLLYLIQAAGLRFGNYGLWALEFFTLLLTFLCLYKISRLLGCGPRTACASVFCGLFLLLFVPGGGNMTEEYALPFLSVSFYIFLRYFMRKDITKRHVAVCGFSCAAVALLRLNMVGLWLVMSSGVIADCVRKRQFAKLISYALWFVTGFCALLAPVLLWLLANHAFADFIQDYLVFNFLYSAAFGSSFLQKLKAIQSFILAQTPYVLLAPAFLFYRTAVKRNPLDALCLLSFAFNLYLMCFSGRTYSHYAMILLPLVAYALSAFFADFSTERQRRAAILTIVLILCGFYLKAVAHNIRHSDPTQERIVEIVKEHTSEADAIAVCGNMDGIYVLSKRWSVSRYSYQTAPCFMDDTPQSMSRRAEFFRDMENGKPKLIALRPTFQAYDAILEIMGNRYRLLETAGNIEVYLLKEGKAG